MVSDILLFIVKSIPFILTILWAAGAIIFYFLREKGNNIPSNPPVLTEHPKVTIVIPCHNEAKTIQSTILSLDHIQYPNFEVIAVNDCSRDNTAQVIDDLSKSRPWMRTIHLGENRGKAAALNVACVGCNSEFIVCIDADSELHPHALTWLISSLINNPKIAAVTGNPRVKNRNNLIGRLQVGEFSATIGMIKRYQQVIGKLFTVSGVIVAYRKKAVLDVGFWDTESVTEDIAMSWRLQTSGWELGYEPRAICDVLMPATIRGLWKQRYRWATGGFEVMSKYWRILFQKGHWALKILYAEYIFSVLWTFAFVIELFIHGFELYNHQLTAVNIIHPIEWGIFISGLLGLLQFLPGFSIHCRYEKFSLGLVFWAVWYPLIYWMLNSAVLMVAIPSSLFRKRTSNYATWKSPDRGGIES